jgi:nitrate reductase beta subunit
MWMYYLQRICNHCTYPACVAACPREAIYKRPEDGIVLVDQTRCRGYQECLTACPYKKTMFNLETRVSEKCIGCYPKIEEGLQTQCTTACIGRLRLTNFLSAPDKADPRKPADYLVHIRKIALPLYPQLGLEPNVYYIPPVHVPTKYLTQMFGPGVEKAVETYRNAENDPELLGLLMLFGATERIMDTWNVENGIARAFDDKGDEIVAVPVREPTFVRPFEFATEVAGEPMTGFRHNT